MAKGSLFWGKGRGKLGEVVLSQLKGQQISRAYQPVVSNPKTTQQTNQRAIFANAVKFYKNATQNLFKFAYEDKRATESYYNAFMRHNTGVAMLPNRTSYNNKAFPSIGNQYMLTQGSLPELTLSQEDTLYKLEVSADIGSFEEGTAYVSSISKVLIAALGLADGDILTLVRVINYAEDVNSEPTTPTEWQISQIVINSNAGSEEWDDDIKNIGGNAWIANVVKADGKAKVTITAPNETNRCVGAAAIVSRSSSNKVLVSNSYLINNSRAAAIYQASLQAGYRQAALNSWGRQSDAILQGSIAKDV